MKGYVSIKQASEMYGVHPDSIRRLWRDSKNRVIPEYQAKITQKDKYGRLLIDTSVLDEHFKPHTEPVEGDNKKDDEQPKSEQNTQENAYIQSLIDQIADLKQQRAEWAQKFDQQQQLTAQAQQNLARLLPAQSSGDQPPAPEPEVYRGGDSTPAPKAVKSNKAKKKVQPKKTAAKKAAKTTKKRWWRK